MIVNHEEPKVKLTKNQLKKIQCAAKNKNAATLRISKKIFKGEELPHELSLTLRRKTIERDALTNNASIYVKLSKK